MSDPCDRLRAQVAKLTAERDALKAELNRERASLSAACEASDRRAADLNREVIAENERLRAELEDWKARYVHELAALNESLKALENATSVIAAIQLRELREAAEAHCALVVHHAPDHEEGIRNRLLDSRQKLRAVLAKLPPSS